MSADVLTLLAALGSFGIFFAIHLIQCRFMQAKGLLKGLLGTFVMVLPVSGIILTTLRVFQVGVFPLGVFIGAVLVATFLYGLLSFFYVLCIFGPYETSVRMRLIREIAKAMPEGMSEADLGERYNDRMIVEMRLIRLLGSGDIIQKEGRYEINNRNNIFALFDAGACVIKKMIGCGL